MRADFKWLALAVRNALRNRRRSLVTLLITASGTAALLLGGGFALQTYDALAEASARDSGHLVVAAPGFFDDNDATPLEHGLNDAAALSRTLLARPGVQRVLPRLQFSGLISNGEKTEIFLGSGVDARQEFLVRGPFMTRVAGRLLDTPAPGGALGVVLGKGLAALLKAAPGSGLTLMSSTTAGSLNAVDVVVLGVVGTGVADIDRRLALVDLSTAQALLATDKLSHLSVYLDDIGASAAGAAALRAEYGATLAVRTWLERAPFYQGVKGLYNRIFGFLGLIVLLLVGFSVTNTLAMAVLERTREIGTLRALGATPAEVMRVFTLEGLALGAGGALLGMALAGATALALLFANLQMPAPPGRTEGYPLQVALSPGLYLGTVAAVAALAALASWLVSRKAAHQSVVEALAYV